MPNLLNTIKIPTIHLSEIVHITIILYEHFICLYIYFID